MKILVCAYTCSPTGQGERFGGGEDVLGWNIIKQLARFHDVWVLAHSRNRESIEIQLGDSNPRLQFYFFELPKWLSSLQNIQGGIQLYAFIWQIWAYFQSRKLHRLHRFQVFHHVTYANDWMASYIGALLPIPYIRGPGGGAHRTPRKFLSEYRIGGRIWELIRSTGQWMFRHDPLFVIGHSKAKAILVCNKEALEAVPHRWRSKTHVYSVCGVSTADLSRIRSLSEHDGVFRVLTAGKLLRIKGFGLALQAFALFANDHLNSKFTIVGDGPEQANLENLIDELGVSNLVRIEKWMDRDELLDKMAASDVFLFPSLRDGGGAVVVEAMATGLPVVCLDISGPGMHITSENGYKIIATTPEESVQDMAQALGLLYRDPNLRRTLGSNARIRAENVYHWDRIGERLADLYRYEIPDPECDI